MRLRREAGTRLGRSLLVMVGHLDVILRSQCEAGIDMILLCSFSWAVGCQGQDGGRVLQVRDGGGPGDIQGCGEEQTREGCGGRGGRTHHCLFCGV